MKILICSALPREIRSAIRLIAGMRLPVYHNRVSICFSTRCGNHQVALVETGIGMEQSGRVLDRAITTVGPEVVLSLGFCGGLTPRVSVGDVLWASAVSLVTSDGVVSTITLGPMPALSRFTSVDVRSGTFFTLEKGMKKSTALRLIDDSLPRPVCDMETHALAAASRKRGTPFFALRAVSDAAEDDIRFDPGLVCDASGFYSPMRAIAFFLSHPTLIGHATKLRQSSQIASRNLALAVESLLPMLQSPPEL